jgi:hypothetical protein
VRYQPNGVSILIPIKVSALRTLGGFRECCEELILYNFPFDLEIVIADESPEEIFEEVDSWFERCSRVTHFRPRDESRGGQNDKMNGIYDAMNYIKYESAILVDDHYRLSVENILQLKPLFSRYDCFKCMVSFQEKNLKALIDVCGMFIINLTHPFHQFHGHLCFNAQTLSKIGFPSRDGLFDELTLELQFHEHGKTVHFAEGIFLMTVHHTTWGRFLEQRVRYAYENLAFPLRFAWHLCVLPILITCALFELKYALGWALCLTAGHILLALWGQIKYGGNRFPVWTFLLSPLWFWFYPFTSWIAAFMRCSGGIYFGGRKIVKPV